jgi:hypothetical protein
LINAIKLRDPAKFTRTVRRTDANTWTNTAQKI